MIDVSDIVADVDLGGTTFTILRSAGAFVSGGYQDSRNSIPGSGIVQPQASVDLDQVPEGDRIKGFISIWSHQQVFETGPNGLSDIIQWAGQNWRVSQSTDWSQGGYYKSIAVRMSGE